MSTDRFVLGTAGHIDHGKTAVVKALTGVDADRLKEEKARGITIELGFAWLKDGETTVGLVDVPGHERFIRAMVAGATGVDAVMVVVAADEGVMPQTREHLAVCSLLGVRQGFIALNKADLVADPEWLELVQADVRGLLAGTFLADAPILPCSATTGQGIPEVREQILSLARTLPARQTDHFFRLPIDRVFSMHGFGTVVTGTLVAGTVRLGDDLVAEPGGGGGKVRGLQVHGVEVDEARAGQRTAINLKGVEREDLTRGQMLLRRQTITPTTRFDAEVSLLDWVDHPVKRGQAYTVLAGTAQALGEIYPLGGEALEPGQTAWIQVELDRPLVLLPGDRFVLQGFALSRDHGSTLGGGVVARTHPPRHRRKDADYGPWLEALVAAPPADRVALEVRAAGVGGIALPDLSERLPFPPPATAAYVADLVKRRALVAFDTDPLAVVHRDPHADLSGQVVEVVRAMAEAAPMATGFPRAEVHTRLGVTVPPRLFRQVVDALLAAKRLEGDEESVAPPGRREQEARQGAAEKIRLALEQAGLEPPKGPDLAATLGLREADVKDVLQGLIKTGKAYRAKDDLVFGAGAVAALQARLVALLKEKQEIQPADFKELAGVSRKYLIPLAELFDDLKVTLRVGNARRLRSPG